MAYRNVLARGRPSRITIFKVFSQPASQPAASSQPASQHTHDASTTMQTRELRDCLYLARWLNVASS
jgi:hypothetical protein